MVGIRCYWDYGLLDTRLLWFWGLCVAKIETSGELWKLIITWNSY